METLDCRGQQCPQPVVQTRRFMLEHSDSAFRTLVNDAASCDNICRLAGSQGYSTKVTEQAGEFLIEMTPGTSQTLAAEKAPMAGPSVILIGSDQMGQGDIKLGQILMKSFLFTLPEAETTPDVMLFINSGVKLTTGGSEVLEPLEQLIGLGVEIASCGLCLEYFDLKDKLAVGRISNMLETVNTLAQAGRIIKP